LWNVSASLSLNDNFCVKEQINISFGKRHIIKRSPQYFTNSNFYDLYNIRSKRNVKEERPKVEKKEKNFTIELAVFVDAEAYNNFKPYLSMKQMRTMMLEYVTHIQTFFHHPSLGVRIDISLVLLDIMDAHPSNFPTSEHESETLLRSFCKYAKTRNFPEDSDPRHWDISLYITGRDLYNIADFDAMKLPVSATATIEDDIMTGLAFSNAACLPSFSCAIAEFFPHEIYSSGIRSSLNTVHHLGSL